MSVTNWAGVKTLPARYRLGIDCRFFPMPTMTCASWAWMLFRFWGDMGDPFGWRDEGRRRRRMRRLIALHPHKLRTPTFSGSLPVDFWSLDAFFWKPAGCLVFSRPAPR